jgi:hypothetical protein
MTFKPIVLTSEDGRELCWLGRLPAHGIFDGGHSFVLQPPPDGRTRFTQTERFRGLLVRHFAKHAREDTPRLLTDEQRAQAARRSALIRSLGDAQTDSFLDNAGGVDHGRRSGWPG